MDNKVRLKYRNEDTAVSGVAYAEKIVPICSSVYWISNLLRFLSVPSRHIDEVGCDRLKASCGTNMSHWEHRGVECYKG